MDWLAGRDVLDVFLLEVGVRGVAFFFWAPLLFRAEVAVFFPAEVAVFFPAEVAVCFRPEVVVFFRAEVAVLVAM